MSFLWRTVVWFGKRASGAMSSGFWGRVFGIPRGLPEFLHNYSVLDPSSCTSDFTTA
jgi:hypothetical protein